MNTPAIALTLFLSSVSLLAANPRPNILFILSDDHSYPFLSCYGDKNVRTPELDSLADGGIRFHRFFTSAPQCVPSRAAYLTGRSPVAGRMTRFSAPLPKDEITFMELLRREAGYHVGVCGRNYHLDGSARPGEGIGGLLDKHALRTFASRLDYARTGSDSAAVEQMREFLDAKPAGKPFCLWLNFSDPHHPWNAPESFRPDPASLRLPAHWPDLPGMRQQLADYCAEVNRLDRSAGAVLKVLAERGLDSTTLVVFAGDNGAALPHGKGSLHDPGSNVPLLVRWPGVVKPRSESSVLLSAEDIAPTLLEAAGATVPTRMTGLSFLSLLQGKSYQARNHVFVERGPHGSAPVTLNMSSSGYDLSRAVRSDRYKFIYNCTPWIPYGPVDSSAGAAWTEIKEAHQAGRLAVGLQATYFSSPRAVYELYDLEKDPSELTNLSGKAELAKIERELRLALAEKMILDFDYLPLPQIPAEPGAANQATAQKGGSDRAAAFKRLDTDANGRLSFEEFSVRRRPEDATKYFKLRDLNEDGFLSREEFLPPNVPAAKP